MSRAKAQLPSALTPRPENQENFVCQFVLQHLYFLPLNPAMLNTRARRAGQVLAIVFGMGNLAQFRSQVIVLTGHEGSGFLHVGEKLCQKIKSSHPESKILFLEGFWSTLGRNHIDFRKILNQTDPLNRFLAEYLEWKKVIEDLKPHYDLVVVSGTWIKHLASYLALNAEVQLHDHTKLGLSDYPIYLVSQNSGESMTGLQKKSFKSLCELSTVGSRWTLVPSSHDHHLDLLYQQVVRNYLSSAI